MTNRRPLTVLLWHSPNVHAGMALDSLLHAKRTLSNFHLESVLEVQNIKLNAAQNVLLSIIPYHA